MAFLCDGEAFIAAVVATAGVVMFLGLMADVFTTVFSPLGRGGIVNRHQNRIAWAGFRYIARALPEGRSSTFLAYAGPSIIVWTLTIWMLWMVIAFALVYYPWMDAFLVSPGTLRNPVVESLYYSGYTGSTLGTGDLVPDTAALRLLAPIQAFAGFALLSISVTYFLGVYRELIRKQSIASAISTYFDQPLYPRLVDVATTEALARWAESTSQSMSEVLLAHYQYPVLHYFRNPQRSRSMPVQLGRLLELREFIRDVGPDTPAARLHEHPSYASLQNTVEQYLLEMEELFVPDRITPTNDDPGTADRLRRAHQRLLAYMLVDDGSDLTR